jgi:hypothetical protein
MRLGYRKVAGIGIVGLAAAAVTMFAPVGLGSNYGGGDSGYITVCDHTDHVTFVASTWEGCVGTGKVTKFNVYYPGGTSCTGSNPINVWHAHFYWPDVAQDQWVGTFCVDGTDHWSPVKALHLSQPKIDFYGSYKTESSAPLGSYIDLGVYK